MDPESTTTTGDCRRERWGRREWRIR